MLDLLVYRLFRNRRVIFLGLIPTLATLTAILAHSGQSQPVWIALGVLLPLVHAVIYPNNWTETLTVSLVTAACLALASTVPSDLAASTLFMRYFWLVFLWFVLFFVLVYPMSLLGIIGPVSTAPVGAVATSHLDAETLKSALAYYPGRNDRRVICGEADEDGRFPVTLRQEFNLPTFEDEPSPELIDIDEDGVLESHGHAVIHSSGPDHHEIFYYEDGSNQVTTCKYEFFKLDDGGTRVLMSEAGTELTAGMRFGMWLSDYLVDYLVDHIDAASGRPPRANRAFRHTQLVVELANVIVPILDRLNGKHANRLDR